MTQTFTLATPPTANKLWRPAGGKLVRTAAYNRWRDAAGWEVKIQRKGAPPIEGRTLVTISLRRPAPTADLDNRIKPVLDALEAGGAIVNDQQVTAIMAAWADHDGCRVTVGADVAEARRTAA